MRDKELTLEALRRIDEFTDQIKKEVSSLIHSDKNEAKLLGNQIWSLADKMNALVRNSTLQFLSVKQVDLSEKS